MTGEFLFEPVPDEEAADFIRSKPAVSKRVFNKLLPELKARAFAIAGVESMTVLQAVRDEIATLPEGGDWDEIKQRIVDQIHPFLASEEDPDDTRKAERRAELLLRTHGFQANQAAAYHAQLEDEDVYPFVQYATAEDDRVRPGHAALEGVIMPFRSEFVQSHWCPWAWGCRCQWIPVTEDDAAELREADAARPAEQKMLFEGKDLERLEKTRQLVRGPNQIHDLRTDPEKGKDGGFHWSPSDMRIPLEELRKRYAPEVFSLFERWAQETLVQEMGLSVWDWLAV